jgi:glycosidase
MPSSLSLAAARRLRKRGPFHLPPGAAPIGTVIDMTLENARTQPEIVLTDARRSLSWRVVMDQDAEQPDRWHARLRLPDKPTIITYQFEFGGSRGPLLERRQIEGENRPIYGEWEQLPFKIAVYDPSRMPAEWTQGMVMYQIFPDRFANGDPSTDRAAKGVYGQKPLFKAWGDLPEKPPLGRDFFGGDLRGVIDKLDYLAELGVDCLYFNPIFHAPTNHRYEAIDYLKIDPMLGGEADFDELVEGAHTRGIRIVLDAVFNHCSSDSPYFREARKSRHSPYYRWFEFRQWPNVYASWWGFGFMPEFAESPEVEDFFLGPDGVTAHWLRKGIDGWRVDVAMDNTDEFWRRMRDRVDAVRPGAYMVSELWRDSTHFLLGDSFSATMNYRFAWAVRGFFVYDQLTASEFDDRLQVWMRDTPPPALLAQMNLLDSHDTDRLMTACGSDRDRFKGAVAFQLAYPGAPTIYYGSETGLEGEFAEDGRRTMPWDALDPDLAAFYRQALALRRESPALRHGSVETVVLDDARRLYGFLRRAQGQTAIALFNGSDAPAVITTALDAGAPKRWRDLFADRIVETAAGALTLDVGARGFVWLASQD